MNALDILDFQPMFINDIFSSMLASRAWYDKDKLSANGEAVYPFVSRTKSSNGVDKFCPRQEKPPEPGNAITIGLDTQAIGYQPVPFYTSQNIQVLRHRNLNKHVALVLSTLIQEQMGKFSWGGNGATLGRLKKTRIMIPALATSTESFSPDWEGMTRLGEKIFSQVLTDARNARQTHVGDDDSLPALNFEPMLIPDVFDVCRQAPAWLNANQVELGYSRWPHVTNTALRNSVSGFIAEQSMAPNPGNAITIGIDTQVVAYQPVPFYGATKVYQLRSKHLNEHSAMILVSSLRHSVQKFSWGHKASAARLKQTRIMVPVTVNADGGTAVDWDGMSEYGNALRVRIEQSVSPILKNKQ